MRRVCVVEWVIVQTRLFHRSGAPVDSVRFWPCGLTDLLTIRLTEVNFDFGFCIRYSGVKLPLNGAFRETWGLAGAGESAFGDSSSMRAAGCRRLLDRCSSMGPCGSSVICKGEISDGRTDLSPRDGASGTRSGKGSASIGRLEMWLFVLEEASTSGISASLGCMTGIDAFWAGSASTSFNLLGGETSMSASDDMIMLRLAGETMLPTRIRCRFCGVLTGATTIVFSFSSSDRIRGSGGDLRDDSSLPKSDGTLESGEDGRLCSPTMLQIVEAALSEQH